jgi:hypothetical protein
MKMSLLVRAAAGIIAVAAASSALAGPMGFSQSWMAMGDLSPNWRETFVNYAVTPRDAIGVEAAYMRSDDKTRSRYLADITYTRLLHRWNTREAQANLWFIGGIGVLNVNHDNAGSAIRL